MPALVIQILTLKRRAPLSRLMLSRSIEGMFLTRLFFSQDQFREYFEFAKQQNESRTCAS